MRRRRVIAGTLAGVVVACAAWAAPGHQPGEPSGTAPVDIKAFTARSIMRTALMDLRLRRDPRPPDLHLASVLVSVAQDWTPDNEELERWQVSLADAGEDTDALDRHLRRLLELAPRDTFVQYRLISSRLRRIQVTEERLAKYEQVLGPGGAALDGAIRSRLASEAAVLLRERGDEAGFLAKLKMATALDPTNKEAAGAALNYFTGKSRDPMGRLELVGNLLNSDPTDPVTHIAIARELFAAGAFESAKRFHDNAIAVYERAGVDRGTPGLLEELAVEWPVDGPAKVVERLNTAVKAQRADVERVIKQLKADLQSTANIPNPEDVRLDPSLDRVRMLAARCCADTQTAEDAGTDLRRSYEAAITDIKGLETGIDDPAAAVRSLRLELATLLSWGGQATDAVAKEIEEVGAETGVDANDPDLLQARGWLLARGDRAAEAVEILLPLADDRPVARLGLGAAYEKLEKKKEAIAEYAKVAAEEPLTIEACWALARLAELTGTQTGDAAMAKKAKAFADAIPTLIDDITREPRNLISLSADLMASSAAATDGAVLRVRVSNLTPMPLGVGPGRTVDSRVLVSPSVEVALDTMREGVLPEVLDLERRIRLMPRETLDVLFSPDPGLTGWLTETNCNRRVRLSWRLLQGFLRNRMGNIDAGPTCLSATTLSLIRSPLAESAMTPTQLGSGLAEAPEAELPGLMLAARSKLLEQIPQPANTPRRTEPISDLSAPSPAVEDKPLLREADQALIAAGAAKRYQSAPPLIRQMLLAGLPHAGQVQAMKALDDAARAETDPATLCLVLVTRIGDPKDGLLERAKASTDPRVAEAARLMSERLEAGASCYAKLGPGLTGLLGRAPEDRK